MKITNVNNLTEFIEDYKVILCDLWGVIHNGMSVYENANKFLCVNVNAVSCSSVTSLIVFII